MATNKEDVDHVVDAIVKNLTGAPQVEKKQETEPAKPDPLFLKEKEKAGKEVTMYSSKFGKPPKSVGPDFPLTYLFQDTDWPEEVRQYIPDEQKFEHYKVDHRGVYPLVLSLNLNKNAFLVGPSGAGKSTSTEMVAARLRVPFLRINGRADMESDTILGKVWVNDGSMEYKIGSYPLFFKSGGIILRDEVNKIPAGIQMVFQRSDERDGVLQLDDMPGSLEEKTFTKHKDLRIIDADNVVGTGDGIDKYAATMIQDGSTINRKHVFIMFDYLPVQDEVELLTNMFDFLPQTWATKMVQLAGLVRKGFQKGELSVTMSMRQLEAWAEMAWHYQDYRKSFDAVMLQRFASDEEKGTVNELWNTVYGK